jgi:glycosyltransferase involved in cell wall biosynthesis
MRIVMFTNLYLPKIGGVTVSVDRFSRGLRQQGHEVLVVAPDLPGQEDGQPHVVRVPALQEFSGTSFSVALPPGEELSQRLDAFQPQIIHSHHPFLLGDSALRAAASRNLPLVYTYHTSYENFTHYFPLDSKVLRNYVVQLATRYTEFCDLVIAPSRSIAGLLRERGVSQPIEVVPTGIEIDAFAQGDRARGRGLVEIDPEAFVIGHVGRLAEEKNLRFLTRSVARAMSRIDRSRFLIVGSGEMASPMGALLDKAGLRRRVVFAGSRQGRDLADLYAAMDAFVFASTTETQGIVLVEALAAGTPVVGLDAPGVREVVQDGRNGRLVAEESEEEFAEAIIGMGQQDTRETKSMRRRARQDAEAFSLDHCVEMMLTAYERVLGSKGPARSPNDKAWDGLLEAIQREWEIWSTRVGSLTKALTTSTDPKD